MRGVLQQRPQRGNFWPPPVWYLKCCVASIPDWRTYKQRTEFSLWCFLYSKVTESLCKCSCEKYGYYKWLLTGHWLSTRGFESLKAGWGRRGGWNFKSGRQSFGSWAALPLYDWCVCSLVWKNYNSIPCLCHKGGDELNQLWKVHGTRYLENHVKHHSQTTLAWILPSDVGSR